jgi:hypothetical protein
VFASACYAPNAPQCTRECAADSDCVSDQRCNQDHFCALPSVTSCDQLADARQADAIDAAIVHDATPDAPPVATLSIHVDGPGSLNDDYGHICNGGDCVFVETPNMTLALTAVPHVGKVFEKWTSVACMGQPVICHLTPPVGVTAVGVKFH